jgi:hypothetical protein
MKLRDRAVVTLLFLVGWLGVFAASKVANGAVEHQLTAIEVMVDFMGKVTVDNFSQDIKLATPVVDLSQLNRRDRRYEHIGIVERILRGNGHRTPGNLLELPNGRAPVYDALLRRTRLNVIGDTTTFINVGVHYLHGVVGGERFSQLQFLKDYIWHYLSGKESFTLLCSNGLNQARFGGLLTRGSLFPGGHGEIMRVPCLFSQLRQLLFVKIKEFGGLRGSAFHLVELTHHGFQLPLVDAESKNCDYSERGLDEKGQDFNEGRRLNEFKGFAFLFFGWLLGIASHFCLFWSWLRWNWRRRVILGVPGWAIAVLLICHSASLLLEGYY